MGEVITFQFNAEPVPASRPRVERYGTHNTPKYDDYKSDFSKELQGAFPAERATPIKGPFKLTATFCRKYKHKADIDNFLKALMDAIQDSGIIENDSDITHVDANMFQVKEGAHTWFKLERKANV